LTLVTVALLAFGGPAAAKEGPKPPAGRTPEVIDYGSPAKYAKLPKSAGDAAHIRKLAAKLKDENAVETFRNLHVFIRSHVPHVPERGWRADHWDFDRLIHGFDHNGCASHGLLFGSLARACGIPVVFIKSSRHEWIRKYVGTGQTGSFSGHVFLEVHVDGAWRLLDAQGMRMWDRYDPSDPELPGGLYAYEKGWDHYAMVHSTRRDDYIREAKARWKDFDVSTLRRNENPGRRLLPRAFAVTIGGEWRALSERITGLMSFDLGYWKKTIDKVKGNFFVVTGIGGDVEVPPPEIDDWLPVKRVQLRKDALAGKSYVKTRTLKDGTFVVLVAAPGWIALKQLIWRTDFEKLRRDFARTWRGK
jgi:hypothetical protein